jgi:hypothetical protein
MRVRWTKYAFRPPQRFSDNDFLHARLYPGEFRRIRWREIGRPMLATIGRVAGIVAITWFAIMELESRSLNGSPILAWFLGLIGFGAVVSLSLSVLSFLLYATDYFLYWERVIKVAKHHEDVERFNGDLRRRGLLPRG